jgi:hypothetical protein
MFAESYLAAAAVAVVAQAESLLLQAVKLVAVVVELVPSAEAVTEAAAAVVVTSDLPLPKNLFLWVGMEGAPVAVVEVVVVVGVEAIVIGPRSERQSVAVAAAPFATAFASSRAICLLFREIFLPL